MVLLLTVDLSAKLPDVNVGDMVNEQRIIEVTSFVKDYIQSDRRFFVTKEYFDWVESDEMFEEGPFKVSAVTCVVATQEMSEYTMSNNGKLDRSQFFFSTHLDEDNPQWIAAVLGWNTQSEETVMICGFSEEMKTLELTVDQPEGALN